MVGEKLIAYEVAGDGTRFRISFICAGGELGSLSLPTECIQALIMTLPRMMTQALLARYNDSSLRLVYPAETVRIEGSPDANTFLLTFTTPDGFTVSFAVSNQQLAELNVIAHFSQ